MTIYFKDSKQGYVTGFRISDTVIYLRILVDLDRYGWMYGRITDIGTFADTTI